MKQRQLQRKISITHNNVKYTIRKSDEGWLDVTGGDEFRYKSEGNLGWTFSKPVDYDLQIRLQNEAIKEQLL